MEVLSRLYHSLSCTRVYHSRLTHTNSQTSFTTMQMYLRRLIALNRLQTRSCD